MKKFAYFMLLPIFACIMVLCGCDTERTATEIKVKYEELRTTYVETEGVSENNIFFSDRDRKNSLVIYYPDNLKNAINIQTPSNDVQARYKALSYQQLILDRIYAYYENNQAEFFRMAESKLTGKQLSRLYDSLSDLRSTLSSFKQSYLDLLYATNNGISDIMESNITSYTFHLNNVIDASFRFMYMFHSLYTGGCIDDFNTLTSTNLSIMVDKAQMDIAYVIYLENFKAFNYAVGENGVCDLSSLISSDSKFNLLSKLESFGKVREEVLDGIGGTDETITTQINEFIYNKDVFEQRLSIFENNFNALNMYNISKHKFETTGGASYDSFISSLNASDRATVQLLDNFIEFNFLNYEDKLSKLITD